MGHREVFSRCPITRKPDCNTVNHNIVSMSILCAGWYNLILWFFVQTTRGLVVDRMGQYWWMGDRFSRMYSVFRRHDNACDSACFSLETDTFFSLVLDISRAVHWHNSIWHDVDLHLYLDWGEWKKEREKEKKRNLRCSVWAFDCLLTLFDCIPTHILHRWVLILCWHVVVPIWRNSTKEFMNTCVEIYKARVLPLRVMSNKHVKY